MKKQKRLVISLIGAIIGTNTLCPNVFVPMVYASNSAVPSINQAISKDNGVVLQWDIPINESSIFSREDFENLGIDLPAGIIKGVHWYGNGYVYDEYGNKRENDDAVRNSLKIIDGVGYGGSKGVKANQTAPSNGWAYDWFDYMPSPNGGADTSNYYIDGQVALKVEKPAIVRLKAKGYGNVGISIVSNWSGNAYAIDNITWGETLTPTEFKERLMNGVKIKINNPTEYTNTRLHVTTAKCTTYDYNFYLSVGCVEKVDNQWYFVPNEWHGAWSDSVKPGQAVAGQSRANEGTVEGKPIYELHNSGGTYASTEVATDEWKDYSFNINILKTKEILDTGSYFEMMQSFYTKSNLYVDEVTVAYAPLSRVYRDGVLIKEDYTAEYTDSEATDVASPDAPDNITTSINQKNMILSWGEPIDHGTNHIYTVSSVNESNEESAKSLEQIVNVATGINHYEVYEGEALLGVTSNTSYTLLNSINLNNVSIVAVDKSGNKSLATKLSGDVVNPIATHTLSTNDWVKDSVKITVTGTDEGYGVRQIMCPDGSIISGDTVTFSADQNGMYEFKIEDWSGNSSTYVVEVKNIDKKVPSIPSLAKEDDIIKLMPGIDEESGINKHEYRLNNSAWKTWKEDMKLRLLEDGIYILEAKAIDNVGNESQISKIDFKITYKQVAEAIAAVERVEETFDIEDYEMAKELVDALEESEIKEELIERLDMIAEILGEERLLKELQEIKIGVLDESISEEEFDVLVERFEAAKGQVGKVTDKTTKKRVEKLVNEIEAIIAAKRHHLTEKTFMLKAVPQIEENNVALDWSTDINLLDYTYRIFSQKNNGSIQSIPAKDTVKVLEIYATKSYLPTWVNQYDLVGKINCDAMSIEKFNETPEVAWNYDVVVLGFADSNGRKDLVETSASILKQYIEAGKGVLFGHDTLSSYLPRPYLCSLAPKLNLVTSGGENYQVATEAYIAQTGGIANYPYKVGKLDDAIIVPATHASYQIPSGDVWVRFNKNNQFYLTTWNNCAMIQTGHNPSVTNDVEQKLLLNTIYYLAQITNQTTWSDYMGQDVDSPIVPKLSNIQTETKNGELSFEIESKDEGTEYTYYVEATCTNDETKVKSNTASTTMLSGLKGYSIVIDEAEDTIPDDEIETTNSRYVVSVDFSKPFYMHIKAIDNVGNGSEVMHYYYTDTVSPTMPNLIIEEDTLKLEPGEDYGFGIEQHLYSINGSEWQVWNDNINLLDFEDGKYEFIIKAIDKAGHESESFTYTVNITYHEDVVNALYEKLDACKLILEDYGISQEEFENSYSEFEALKIELSEIEDIDNRLTDEVSKIKEILNQREISAEEEGARAEYYVRLAEKYQKESYIERARQYVEELIASIFKSDLMKRIDEIISNLQTDEEDTTAISQEAVIDNNPIEDAEQVMPSEIVNTTEEEVLEIEEKKEIIEIEEKIITEEESAKIPVADENQVSQIFMYN